MTETNINPTETTYEQVYKKSNKKLYIWMSISVLLLVVIIISGDLGLKYYQHKQLVQEYNQDFNKILVASKFFADKVSKEPEQTTTFNALVDYYQKLKSQNDFDAQIQDLNNNLKYSTLKEKMDISALAISKPTDELNQLLNDIDNIQIGLQKSKDVDNEIRVLETTTTTIDQYGQKIDDLTVQNEDIKKEMLGTIVQPFLKKAHEDFVKALTYRESYLSESKAANSAYLDALNAEDLQKQQNQLAQKYINMGANSFFSSSSYYLMANEANQFADEQIQKARDKYDQQATHKQEAMKMLAKYFELMGEYDNSSAKDEVVTSTASKSNDISSTETKSTDTVFPLDTGISPEQQITDLVKNYVEKAVQATKDYDFSVVAPYIDANGKTYKEGKSYLGYLKSKNIHEDLISIDVVKIDKQNEKEFQVYTNETYDISYKDGTTKRKSFKSTFLVVHLSNGFFVNSLIVTKEV